ncbi:hypothetical protein Tco_1250604 [Tanacetum coccineum]
MNMGVVVTGNEGGWGAKKLVNDSEKAARSGSSWGQKVLWALKKRGQHFGNQDQSILLRRSDHWRDVKNRVIRKPSRTSVASNSTTGQGLINPPEEHVGCAYGGQSCYKLIEFIPASLLLKEYKAEAIRLMNTIHFKAALTELHQRLGFPFTNIKVRVFSDL